MRRLLPFLLLGPITGPLSYGLKRCLADGRNWMACVYAAGLVEALVALPWIAAELVQRLPR